MIAANWINAAEHPVRVISYSADGRVQTHQMFLIRPHANKDSFIKGNMLNIYVMLTAEHYINATDRMLDVGLY